MQENINNLKKSELLDKCKELNITGCSSKKKSELIKLINEKIENNLEKQETVIETKEEIIIENKKKLKPLIKWSGGKGDEIKYFEKYIPKDFELYLEPFIGGGAVYFYIAPQKAVISDVHKELVDFYKSISENKTEEIYEFMENNNNTEETYYNVRDNMVVNNSLDDAKRFYYLRKTCFRGMLRYNKNKKFNIPFGRYKKINYEELRNKDYEELLNRTEILNKSFEYLFKNYNKKENFMFLDPPYDSEFTDYGYCEFGKKEHETLAKLFKKTKIRCLMIIGKTKFIEELYKDYIVDEYEKNYRFKLYAGRIGNEINTKHLIIKNY
jgi:DNA adenine methylase